MFSVVQAPDKILRTATRPASLPPARLREIITEMTRVLKSQTEPEGVGLAANQVGLPYSLFLARFSTKKTEPVRVFINPEVLEHSPDLQPEDKKTPLEGCLSLPKYYGVVKRFKWVVLKYQNEKLEMKNEKFAGFPAVVIQHEMDHLNGRIFVERILEQNGKLYKTNGKDKRGKDEWEEIEL